MGPADLTGADESHRYLSAVDQLLADEQVANPQAAGNVVWPLADQQGTINDLAVYNSQTGITSVANHRVYDSFGNLIVANQCGCRLLVRIHGAAVR